MFGLHAISTASVISRVGVRIERLELHAEWGGRAESRVVGKSKLLVRHAKKSVSAISRVSGMAGSSSFTRDISLPSCFACKLQLRIICQTRETQGAIQSACNLQLLTICNTRDLRGRSFFACLGDRMDLFIYTR